MKVSFNNYAASLPFRAGDKSPLVCAGKNDTDITPNELYERFRTGERPYYEHDLSRDKSAEKLSELTERYKSNPTIRNKRVLLNHERKMLYEELEHPELTLARNYRGISSVIPVNTSPKDIDKIITNFNLTGLARIERLSKPFETRYTNKKIKLLDKIYFGVDEDTEYGKDIKYNALLAIEGVNWSSKESASEGEKIDFSPLIDGYNITKEPEILKGILQVGTDLEKSQITPFIENILLSEPEGSESRRLALWGSGRFRSEKNFYLTCEAALNPDEDILSREYALHSVSLYLRERPDEVKDVLDKVSHDGSVFEPLAKILKDKVEGNYHNIVNREYSGLSKDEINALNNFKKTHLFYDKKLNRRKQNAIDNDLIQYKYYIMNDPEMVNPIAVIQDTYTRVCQHETGKRNFTQGLKNDGCFVDSVDGVHTSSAIIMKNDLIADSQSHSVIAHEMGHELNDYLSDSELEALEKLYQNSLDNGSPLGDYAGRNIEEYFAVGCDSMSSVYKPHSLLLKSDYGNTRYSLMAKDPELYKFIKQVLRVCEQ